MFILGTKVHNVTLAQALKKAEGFFYDEGQHYIVTPNPEIILKAAGDVNYRNILNKADLSIPDGVGLLWASRRLYKKNYLKERIAGVDFIIEFLKHLSQNKCTGSHPIHFDVRGETPYIKILLLGAGSGIAKKTAQKLNGKFSNLDFYGMENVENVDLEFIIKEIIQPDCIFVALGAPKQEKWIAENLKKFSSIKIAMGVGGAFDMISGKNTRAPRTFRENRGEWLWRLIIQPSRIGRIFNAVVVFPLLVFKEKFIHSLHS